MVTQLSKQLAVLTEQVNYSKLRSRGRQLSPSDSRRNSRTAKVRKVAAIITNALVLGQPSADKPAPWNQKLM